MTQSYWSVEDKTVYMRNHCVPGHLCADEFGDDIVMIMSSRDRSCRHTVYDGC